MTRHYPPLGISSKDYYFNHVKGLSNSGLTRVEDWLKGQMDKPIPEKAFRFGSLVDAMLTQPEELDEDATDMELLSAIKVKNAILAHPLGRTLLTYAEPQAIVTNEILVDFEGIEKRVLAKCMLDGYLPKFGIGKDDKTTAARSQAQFESSIDRFNYDRQAYWYMEIAELDRFVFIGASKTRIGEVFIKIIKRGDPLWLSGKEKASALAYYSDVATI